MAKTKKTFEQWAKVACITDDPVGDFLSDWRTENLDLFPRPHIKTKASLISHLRNTRDACDEALEAAKDAWLRFEAWAAEGATK